MKTIVLCLSAIVILVAGCSKTGTTTTGRDAFVGTYLMKDTFEYYPSNPTTVGPYTMTVLAVSGSSDRAAFSNIDNQSNWDTAIVSGSVATFVNYHPGAASATLSGSKITLTGGYVYSNVLNPIIYGQGNGTKQ